MAMARTQSTGRGRGGGEVGAQWILLLAKEFAGRGAGGAGGGVGGGGEGAP